MQESEEGCGRGNAGRVHRFGPPNGGRDFAFPNPHSVFPMNCDCSTDRFPIDSRRPHWRTTRCAVRKESAGERFRAARADQRADRRSRHARERRGPPPAGRSCPPSSRRTGTVWSAAWPSPRPARSRSRRSTQKLTVLNRRTRNRGPLRGVFRRRVPARTPGGRPWRSRAAGAASSSSCRTTFTRRSPTEALRKRLPVLVEKPLTPTLAEAQALVALARELGVYGAVDFHKRWDLMNLKLKETIEDGRLGAPLYSIVEYSQRPRDPGADLPELGGEGQPVPVPLRPLRGHSELRPAAVPRRAMAVGQRGCLGSQAVKCYDSVQACVEWSVPGSTVPFVSTFAANWIDPNTTSALSYQSLKIIGTCPGALRERSAGPRPNADHGGRRDRDAQPLLHPELSRRGWDPPGVSRVWY